MHPGSYPFQALMRMLTTTIGAGLVAWTFPVLGCLEQLIMQRHSFNAVLVGSDRDLRDAGLRMLG